jgi:hypothetical protein
MMLLGFGLIGMTLRHRDRRSRSADRWPGGRSGLIVSLGVS